MLKAIACIDSKGGLGNTKPPFIPWLSNKDIRKKDLSKFKELTTADRIIIMGRKTFESLPGLLPHRVNVVLTTDTNYFASAIHKSSCNSTCITLKSKEEVITWLENRDAWVIGGAQTYKIFSKDIEAIHLTRLTDCYSCNIKFPLEILEDFKLADKIVFKDNPIESFNYYLRVKPCSV